MSTLCFYDLTLSDFSPALLICQPLVLDPTSLLCNIPQMSSYNPVALNTTYMLMITDICFKSDLNVSPGLQSY